MADQEANSGGNGADDNGQPQVSILAQYVKDLSVENPSAPQVYSWQVQPSLDVQFNLNVQGAGEGVHEVTLKFDISARSENGVHFVIDLSYAGLFGIRNVPDEALPPFLLIEAPRLLFPFARQVISDAIFVAFRLPNMFRALFAEGAFSAAFIPMFNRKVGEADDVHAGLRFAEQTLAVLLPVLLVFTAIMLLAAWPITWGLSGGFKN